MYRLRSPKFFGLLAPAVGFVSVFLCVSVSPWFNFYDNALSDLGNTDLHGATGWIFNLGLVLSGLILAIFAVSIVVENRSWKYSIWGLPLLGAGLDVALIGVFSENSGRVHFVVSVLFFALIIIAALLYSYASWPLGRPRTGAVALTFGIVMTAVWLAEWPWSGLAIQEASTATLAAIWLVIVAYTYPSPEPSHLMQSVT